jgi:hypothetical protein
MGARPQWWDAGRRASAGGAAPVALRCPHLQQQSPVHPSTPLPAKKLARILGGSATIGDNGVVTVDVPRKHGVILGGVRVSPGLNTANTSQFGPRAGGAGGPWFPTSR